MGYHRAGFDVVGVDIQTQPRYPFEFIKADCMSLDRDFISSFDAIHASPPCQGYTDMRHAPGAKGAPMLVNQVREMLEATGKPYVIENVPGCGDLLSPMILCGTMFGLEAEGADLWRHRLFESNVDLHPPSHCKHDKSKPTVGIYGGHARIRSKRHGGRGTRDVWPNGHKPVAQKAMGMDWATLHEMSEAIPPAYTEWIGKQIMGEI